jgi:hypothetical protein
VSPSAVGSNSRSTLGAVACCKRFRRGARGDQARDRPRGEDLFPHCPANIPKDIGVAYGNPGKNGTFTVRPAIGFPEEKSTAAEWCLS